MNTGTGEMDLNISPKPSKLGRGKTYSGSSRNSIGNLAGTRTRNSSNKTDFSISPIRLSPKRRNSLGTLSSVSDRRKSRTSYLNKKKGREGAGDRKELIRSSLFSKVDTVFGDETSDAAGGDVSFQNENSYLKRLLLSPSSSAGGKKAKKLNVDNCRLQKKKRPPKMKLTVPQVTVGSTKSSSSTNRTSFSSGKPKVSPTAKTTLKNKTSSSSTSNKRLTKDEQNEKRLSADSIDTAPTEGSDSTDNDTLISTSLITNSTASLTIDTSTQTTAPDIDYTDLFYSFETVKVDVDFEAPSVERQRKISFAPQAQVASIADLIICSSDTSKEFQWEDLFYTEEELGDQRHEAFLEMCGLDDEL